jgi:hypothetical protein
MDEIDPYLDQMEEDEFDPDDIEGPGTDGYENFQNPQDVVQGVIDEEYDYENSEDEASEEEEDRIMSNSHDDSAESVDLDGPSQQERTFGSAARLRSPFDFKDAPDQDASEDVDATSDSDRDELSTEIPARRSIMRVESVDLDGA